MAARRSSGGSGSGGERRSGKTAGDKVPAEQLIGSDGAAAVAPLPTFQRRPRDPLSRNRISLPLRGYGGGQWPEGAGDAVSRL